MRATTSSKLRPHLGVAVYTLLWFAMFVTPPGVRAEDAGSYAYLFTSGGQFLKLKFAPVAVVAQWNLRRVAGVSTALPQTDDWRLQNLRADAGRSVLYGAFEERSNEPMWRVIGLSLPALRKVLDVGPFVTLNAPIPLLAGDGKALMVTYTPMNRAGNGPAEIKKFDVASGKLLSKVQSEQGWLQSDVLVNGVVFGWDHIGYFGPDGSVTWAAVDARDWLEVSERNAWRSLGGADGLVGTSVSLAALSGQKGLVSMSEPRGLRRLVVVDLASRQVVSPLIDAPIGAVRLSSEGTSILVSEIKGGVGAAEYTGRLWRYDLLRHAGSTVQVQKCSGTSDRVRWLCDSADGSVVLMACRGGSVWRLVAAGFEGKGSVSEIPSTFVSEELPDCVVASE